MGTELRYPSYKPRTESEKQLHSYLYQLVDQLQFALNSMGTSSTASIQPAQKNTQQSSSSSSSPTVDFAEIKARGGLSLFDSEGTEVPLDSTMPLPRGQVSDGWNPDDLECGVYAVTDSRPLKYGDTVIMYNGVLIQLMAYVGGNVKVQLALTSDENRSPYYRVNWFGNWGNWRSFKL